METAAIIDWDDMPLDQRDDMVKDRKDHFRTIMDRDSWKCNSTSEDLESHNGYTGYVHTAMGCLCYWWDAEQTIHAHLYPPGLPALFDRKSYVAYVNRYADNTLLEPDHDTVYRQVLPLMLYRIFERDMVLIDALRHRITAEAYEHSPFNRKNFRPVHLGVDESVFVPKVGDVYVYSLEHFPCAASDKTAVLELVPLDVNEPTLKWSIEATFQATILFDDAYICSQQITVDTAYTEGRRLCAEAVRCLSMYWRYVVGTLDIEIHKNTPAIGPYGASCFCLGIFKKHMRINIKEKFKEFFAYS